MFKKILNILVIGNLLLTVLCCADEAKNKIDEEDPPYRYTNDLINETSPYLLDHAHNPVNWKPWEDEAFEEARSKDQLVIISIGYSSCHWCHVMEEETFENEEVAGFMNNNFVNIKVDREERPDIDEVYMTAINLIKGTGGWPLNIIALPDGKPIYTGTYHTTEQWKEVLAKINKSYQENPGKVRKYANMIAEGIQQSNYISVEEEPGKLEKNTLIELVNKWAKNWDGQWGGDRGDQKFMLPSTYEFILDYALLQNDTKALDHVKNSLEKMGNRGVYDHVGGGFFRYSTDAQWMIPHYEKMLYDNAQLISLYSKAYRAIGNPEYKEIVEEVTHFLRSTMKDEKGAFYSAIDADSNGEEGKYYTWEESELNDLLDQDYELFSEYYQIQQEGKGGRNVIFKNTSDSEFLKNHSLSEEELEIRKTHWKNLLLIARKERNHPAIDDKIIISWNALLISGLAESYKAFGEKEHLALAESIIDFIQSKAYKNGKLIHSYKKGGREVNGFLDDYAYLMRASIGIFTITQDKKYLDFSEELLHIVEENFCSPNSPLYHYSENEELISTILKVNDGVMPSPNSVMAENLFLMGHIYYKDEWLNKAEEMIVAVQSAIQENPAAFAKWNHLYLKESFNFLEIAVVGMKADQLSAELWKNYYPNSIIAGSLRESTIPLFKERYMDNETYIYVCENRSCKRPVTSASEAENLINEIR